MTDDKKNTHEIKIDDSIFDQAVASIEKISKKNKGELDDSDRAPEGDVEVEVEIEAEVDYEEENEEDSGEGDRVAELEQQLEEKTREASENYERLLRVTADLDNFRKRVNRERADFHNYGNERLLREILPVIDNLERAITSTKQSHDFESLVKGVELNLNLFVSILNKFEVEEITAIGRKFDPAVHEAMARTTTDEHPPDTVIAEHQRGYMLKDRLLRPAMVSVSAKPEDECGQDSSPDSDAECTDPKDNTGNNNNGDSAPVGESGENSNDMTVEMEQPLEDTED